MSVGQLSVAIADDAVLFREGLVRLVTESGFDVTCQVGNADALIEHVRRDPPDLVIVDLRMPPDFAAEGLEAARAIRALSPEVGVLILSQYVETHYALQLMTEFDRGVGYLLKDRVTNLASLRVDLHRVAAGDVVIDPDLVRRLVSRQRTHDPLDALTGRERSVLTLMAQGLTNLALADELHLSVKTIETHVRSIFTKLQLEVDDRDNRRVLAVLAFLRQ